MTSNTRPGRRITSMASIINRVKLNLRHVNSGVVTNHSAHQQTNPQRLTSTGTPRYLQCFCLLYSDGNRAKNLSSGQVCTSAKYLQGRRSEWYLLRDRERAATQCNPNSTQCFIYHLVFYSSVHHSFILLFTLSWSGQARPEQWRPPSQGLCVRMFL